MTSRRLLASLLSVAFVATHPSGVASADSDFFYFGVEGADLRLVQRTVGVDSLYAPEVLFPEVVGFIPPSAVVPLSIEERLEAFRNRTEPFTGPELRELLELIGYRGEALRQAWAVAMKESTGHPLAHNTNRATGDNSYGLFQINMIDRLGPYRREKFNLPSNEVLFDPVTNAQVAYHMSNEGTNFGHWGIGPDAYKGSTLGSYPRWYRDFPQEAYTDE